MLARGSIEGEDEGLVDSSFSCSSSSRFSSAAAFSCSFLTLEFELLGTAGAFELRTIIDDAVAIIEAKGQ
jgi:hypothetical protein